MALGPTAVATWLGGVEELINFRRGGFGLRDVKLRVRDDGNGRTASIFSTLGTRTVRAGIVDYDAHVVTDRGNGPLGSHEFSVVMVDVDAKLAA